MSFYDKLFGPPNIEKLKAEGNVKGLIKALGYKKGENTIAGEYHIRKNAAEALGEIGDRQAVEPLIAALNYDHSKDRDVCYKAIGALGAIGDLRAFDPLVAILENTSHDENIRNKAISALTELVDSHRLIHLINIFLNFPKGKDGYDVKRYAYEKLVKIGDPAVEPLINSLNMGNTYWESIALGKIGDSRAVESLIAALEREKSGKCRKEIVTALGKIGDRRATEHIINALNDSWGEGNETNKYGRFRTRDVAKEAAWALGKLGDPRAVEPLINTAITNSVDMDLRKEVSIALGKIGDTKTVLMLMEYLKVENDYVQESAALALEELMKSKKDRRIVPQLISNLKSNKNKEVQKSIIISLGYIGDPIAISPIIEIIEKKELVGLLFASEKALKGILETMPESIPIEDLKRIIKLESYYFNDDIFNLNSKGENIDFSKAKKLASEELKRRGLNE